MGIARKESHQVRNKSPSISKKEMLLIRSDFDPWFNACLNFTHDQLALYVSGYRRATEILNKHVLENRYVGLDTLVYPIIFLYRQYIELQLKSLVKDGSILLDSPEYIPKTHDIKKLWRQCRKILEKIYEEDSESLDEIEEIIFQLSDIDPYSQAFRYPEDKEGKNTLPGIGHINLKNIYKIMRKICSLLEGAETGISEYLSNKF